MEPSDAELMRRWQRGDPLSFEALVRRWQQPVGRLLARLAGPELAADLAQEVFLRVYQAGGRYREQGAFTTWIYRIVLNVAHDAGRRRRRQPPAQPLSLVLASGHEPANTTAPVDTVCRQEAARLLNIALADLPPPLREVLVLRHHEGLAFEEIARLTGTPASTLKSRFQVALSRLRQRMQQLGWEPEEKAS